MALFDEILARVTIPDILMDCGVDPGPKNRISCPIHGGNNPQSFSYNDHTFICFSCGASGGLIDLVEHLRHCNKEGALKYLDPAARSDKRRQFRA